MEINKIINVNCFSEFGLKSLPNNSIKVVITDPPYLLIKVEEKHMVQKVNQK